MHNATKCHKNSWLFNWFEKSNWPCSTVARVNNHSRSADAKVLFWYIFLAKCSQIAAWNDMKHSNSNPSHLPTVRLVKENLFKPTSSSGPERTPTSIRTTNWNAPNYLRNLTIAFPFDCLFASGDLLWSFNVASRTKAVGSIFLSGCICSLVVLQLQASQW